MGENADSCYDIKPYLKSGHTMYCCRRVFELEPLLQQVAAICKVQEGVVILHSVSTHGAEVRGTMNS